MIEKILMVHKLTCDRRGMIWEYMPVKIVPELFYNESGEFNQELYSKVIEGAVLDNTQSIEERGAVGKRHLVHVNRLRQLL
jgi:hypothetical protein